MTAFDKREDTEEKKFAHDSELEFKVSARRNRLFGEWVAEELGKEPEELAAYAQEVIESDFQKPGDDDVIEKVLADYENADIAVDERDLREKLEEFATVARAQIIAE